MNKRALIVEDDVNIAELLMLYLEKDGFDVSIAHDGGKGMAMFNELNPDLVLLDALPVYEEHFSLMNDTVRLVEFVKHHWFQQLSLREEVLHFEIALLMQLVGCNPDERNLPEWQVATALQFFG